MSAACDFTPGVQPMWKLRNEYLEMELCACSRGLCLISLLDKSSGTSWLESAYHPLTYVSFQPSVDMNGWTLQDWVCEEEEGAIRLEVTLTHGSIVLVESLWLSFTIPVFRRWVELHNTGGHAQEVLQYHLLDLWLQHDLRDSSLNLFYVEAFAGHRWDRWDPGDASFALHNLELAAGDAMRLPVGAYQQCCSWIALRRPDGAGLVSGLEYDGPAEFRLLDVARVPGASTWRSSVYMDRGVRLVASPVEALHVRVAPDGIWRSPAAFLGIFDGDWDAAAQVTHALVEHKLSPPYPDKSFPYVIFNTWGYAWDLTPEITLRCLEVAADVGVEVFVADYGWARGVGDWVSLPVRMPRLDELAEKVHSLGMKFGAWMAFANASPESNILHEHPNWTAWPNDWGSFGTRALCLAEPEVRQWVTDQVIRVVKTYGLDYIVHDFELITPCEHPAHSHPPDPAGYHSAEGYRQVLWDLRRACPDLIIENCQGGGRIMTYAMTTMHDTSITTDGAVLLDPLGRRRALYGASYPFPLRYCASYMQESPSDYSCRSCMIGGPWILMGRAAEWNALEVETVRRNVALYKRVRPLFREAQVYHLRYPDGVGWDGLQVHHPSKDIGAVLLFRPNGSSPVQVKLKGLDPDVAYSLVSTDGRIWEVGGDELMRLGISLDIPEQGSEVILLEAKT